MNPRRRRHNRQARKRRRLPFNLLAIHLEQGARYHKALTAHFESWFTKQALQLLTVASRPLEHHDK